MALKFSNLRLPRTTNEKRAAVAFDDDFVGPRAKRAAHNLPDVYDDKFVSESKTWKRAKRKRQWQKQN